MTKWTRSIPLIRNSLKASTSRQFHRGLLLRNNWMPSPRLKAARQKPTNKPPPNVKRAPPTQIPEADLPPLIPLDILESGYKSGALHIKPYTALDLLKQCQQDPAAAPTPAWGRKLCSDHITTPSTLVFLSKLLNRFPGPTQRQIATKLMLTASLLSEPSATFHLLSSALEYRTIDSPMYAAPLTHLGILAKKEGNRQAMALLGKVLLSHSKEIEALTWFRKSTSGRIDFEDAAEALVNEGRILSQRGEVKAAKFAFSKAALELDDPAAYFYLSKCEREGSAQQQEYLLKAAGSGIAEACHNLGSLELAQIEKREQKPRTIEKYGMAREWFQVAAAEGFGLSMLNLALMYRAVGRFEDGMQWLKQAEELKSVREQARKIKAQWMNENVEIS